MASITLCEGLTRFEINKKTLRPRTVLHYHYLLHSLRQAVDIAQLAERPVGEITCEDLSQVLFFLDNPSYFPTMGDSTKTKLVKLLKSVFAWFCQNQWTSQNPAGLLRFRKTYSHSTQPFTPKELADLLGVPPVSAADRRDLCLWSVFADTGGRCEEICSLKLSDWNGSQLAISNGKGGKPRVVSLGQSACEMLRQYVDQDRPKGDEHLFLTVHGTPMTPSVIAQRLKRWAKKADVEKAAPHRFRATFATLFALKENGNLIKLQALLGHSTLDMSRHYVKLALEEEACLTNSADSVVDGILGTNNSPGISEQPPPATLQANPAPVLPTITPEQLMATMQVMQSTLSAMTILLQSQLNLPQSSHPYSVVPGSMPVTTS
jgi:integrase/recombinase XerD